LASQDETRRDLHSRIEGFITRCERQRLVPDAWESEWLTKAIAHLRGCNLEAGEEAMRRAETPRNLRNERDVSQITMRPLATLELRRICQRFLRDRA